jgi:gas vesicle protein
MNNKFFKGFFIGAVITAIVTLLAQKVDWQKLKRDLFQN